MSDEVVVEARELTVSYPIHSTVLRRVTGHVHAVRRVNLQLRKGSTLGLVGESGCGKSTLGRAIAGLLPMAAGDVLYRGESTRSPSTKNRKRIRRRVQMIFQDPYASLNPRRTARQIIQEPWEIHREVVSTRLRRSRAMELLELVGMDPSHAERYPHQFSGGQQQRIAIARALALEPEVLVCDESVSALDVSVQGQVLRLLQRLQREMGLSYLFISHDLAVMKMIADQLAVMYLGRVVESGPTEQILSSPTHPYSHALLAAVPLPDPVEGRKRERIVLKGDVPSPANPPSGCVFRTRCPIAQDVCAEVVPELERRHGTQFSACHFSDSYGGAA